MNDDKKKEVVRDFLASVADGMLLLELLKGKNVPLNVCVFPHLYYVDDDAVKAGQVVVSQLLPRILQLYFSCKRASSQNQESQDFSFTQHYIDILMVKFLLVLLMRVDAYFEGFIQSSAPEVIKVITEAPRNLIFPQEGREGSRKSRRKKQVKEKSDNGSG